MGTINVLPRVFKMGSVRLVDPDPSLSPDDAIRLYVPNYPQITNALLSDPVREGDELVFSVLPPPVQTKG